MKCWICGANADSGEHFVKASDIKLVFGPVSPSKPLFLHMEGDRSKRINGVHSRALKSKAKICKKCNEHRTQQHDNAWKRFSEYLHKRRPPIKTGDTIRLSKVFPGSVKRSMLYVHLYFLKVFGCYLVEHGAPIDIKTFSYAILNNTPHPYVHITVCPRAYEDKRSVGGTAAESIEWEGRPMYIVWCYILDRVTIKVTYSILPSFSRRKLCLIDSWHPSRIKKYLRVGSVT